MSAVAQRARFAGLGVVVLASALLLLNSISALESCSQLRPVHEGEAAPSFAVPRILATGALGEELDLASTRGSVVILDFWATWCGPCQASMPVLEEMAQKFASRGLVVLSINTEGAGKARAARKMADQLAPSSQLLSDTGAAASLYKVTTIPHMLVLDREGTVRWVHRGFDSRAALRRDLIEAIEPLL